MAEYDIDDPLGTRHRGETQGRSSENVSDLFWTAVYRQKAGVSLTQWRWRPAN